MAKLSWLTGRVPEPEILSTPSFGLNRALNGGLFSGRIHVYWGPKASGKTTAALHQIAEAQRQGKICGYVDAERSFNKKWAEKCGVDVDKLRYINKNVAEELVELVCPSLASGELDLLVVDSLSSLGLSSYLDKPEQNAIGSYARASKFFTHKVLNVLNHDQQIIFISHAALDFNSGGTRPAMRAAIGNAIDHWASTIVKFQLRHGTANTRDDGARRVSWRIDKSKTSPYPIEGDYFFQQTEASIDYIAEIVSYCADEGVVQKGGSWLYFPDKETCGEDKWQSEAKFVIALRERPDLLAKIEQELYANGVRSLDEDEELEEA